MTRRPSLEDRRTPELSLVPNDYDVDDVIYACDSRQMEAFSSYSTTVHFYGACIDTGAQRSVIGIKQAEAYCRMLGIEMRKDADKRIRRFRFGKDIQDSVGSLQIRVPIKDDFFMVFTANVVNIDVPLLLGLDVMSEHKLVADTVDLVLFSKSCGWQLPLTRQLGHVYLTWESQILYSSSELTRIHRHFFHANPDPIFNLMKRAGDPEATAETLKQLKDITESCDTCQRLAKEPSRFRVSLPPDDIVFNRTVKLDIMFLEDEPALHIIDRDTSFSSAAFLSEGQTADHIWHVYMRLWVIPYIGFSQTMHTDQGTQFTSERWRNLLLAAGIRHEESGVESHNALGTGERYHAFLRQIYRKVRASHPQVSKEYALALAVRAMNETAGPKGLSPMLLVFGVSPRTPLSTKDLPEQRERMKALKTARIEMAKHVAKARISTAKHSNVPRAADADIKAGVDVLTYREGQNEWTGPFKVLSSDGKQVIVEVNGKQKVFSIDKVKLYKQPDNPAPENSSPAPAQGPATEYGSLIDDIIAADTFFTKLHNKVVAEKKKDPIVNEWNFDEAIPAFVTEVLKPGDSRAESKQFDVAKQKEVNGLKLRGTFCPVNLKDIPKDANIVGGRFVLTIKNKGTDRETAKARYVAQGHRDKEKPFIVHNTTTLRQSSVKIILSTCAVRNFRVFSHDVTQAYLQSDEELGREVYLRPRKHDLSFFGISEGQVLRLVRALYGITDAGDYWNSTMDNHIKTDLGMNPLETDPSLYIPEGKGDISGLLGAYIDDCLLGGAADFQHLTERTLKRFDSRPREWDNIEFLGVVIKTEWANTNEWKRRVFTLAQPECISKLTKVPTDVTYEKFRSVRAAFGWLGHSRPDVCCAINRAAQATEESFSKKHIEELNRAIHRVRSTPDLSLRYGPLDRGSLHLRAYVDASFASNDDHSSQLGYVILLCDGEDRCHVLDFASRKCKRVVRSIMAGETYAFAEGFDCVFALKHQLEKIHRQRIPVTMLTDSKQIFDVITKASLTAEKRLMIDIAAAREAYNRHEISNVGLVLSEHNLADSLTKPGIYAALETVVKTGYDRNPVQQWIFRGSDTQGLAL